MVIQRGLPETRFAVFITPLHGGQLHVGIAWRDDDGAVWAVHQSGHSNLRVEVCSDQAWWVLPALDVDEVSLLVYRSARIARWGQEQALPFGFDLEGATAREDGRLSYEIGVNCVGFVLAVFRGACVELLDLATWEQPDPTRREEDRAAQRRMVDQLRSWAPTQASVVERQVGVLRVRPEEVAAASGMRERPVTMADITPVAGRLLEAMLSG